MASTDSTWIAAANGELARLAGERHYHKMRNTILALVDARLAGRSEETVFGRADTCSRNTYHARWKRRALFAEVLASVEVIAREWRDTMELRALREAARLMALASPVAAGKAITQLSSGDGNLVLRAAFGILDRAGKETASKSSVSVDMVTADDLAEAREVARRYREERGLPSTGSPSTSCSGGGEGVEE